MTKKVLSVFLALLLALSTFAVTASAYERYELDDLIMQLDQAKRQAEMEGRLGPGDELYFRIEEAMNNARFADDWEVDSWCDQINSMLNELNGGGGSGGANYPAEWGAIIGSVAFDGADRIDISFDNIQSFIYLFECRVTDASGNGTMANVDWMDNLIRISFLLESGTYILTVGRVEYMDNDWNMGTCDNLSIIFTVNFAEGTVSFGGAGNGYPAEWGAGSGRWNSGNVYITFANNPFFFGGLNPSLKKSTGEDVFAYIDASMEQITVEGIFDSGTYTLNFERIAADLGGGINEYENVTVKFTYDDATGSVTLEGSGENPQGPEPLSTELSYPEELGELQFFGNCWNINAAFSNISQIPQYQITKSASVTNITTGETAECLIAPSQHYYAFNSYGELAPGDYVLSADIAYGGEYAPDTRDGHINIPFSIDANGVAFRGEGYLSDTCVYPESFGLLGGWAEETPYGLRANIFFSEKDEFDFYGCGNGFIFENSTGDEIYFDITFQGDFCIISIDGAWETLTSGTYTLYYPAFISGSLPDSSLIQSNVCIVFTVHDDNTITFAGQDAHQHSFSNDWAYNDIYHWHPCTNPACDLNRRVDIGYVAPDKIDSLFTDSAEKHIDENGDFCCDVCENYDAEGAAAALPGAKTAAIDELTDYAGSEPDADILAIIESGTAAINNAQRPAAVEEAKIAAIKAIADIILATPRADAIIDLEEAAGENPSAAVLAIVEDAEEAIGNTLTADEITVIKEQALADIAAQLALEAAQAEAITALETAAGENPSAEVLAILEEAETAINGTADTDAVAGIKTAALADIAAQLALEAAQAEAVTALETAAGENPSAEVLAILEEAKTAINGTADTDAIAGIKTAALADIAAQLTVDNAKSAAITALETAAGENPSADTVTLLEAAEAQIANAKSEAAVSEIALTAVKAIAAAALEDAVGEAPDYTTAAIAAFAAARIAAAATVEECLAEQQQALAAVAEQAGSETFSTEWSTSSTHHWHASLDENSDRVSGFGAHTFGTDGKCTVCGYENTAGGEKKYTVILTGISNPEKNYSGATDDSGICNFENIENGTYLMAISCEGAVTRTYTTEITDSTVRQDIELYDEGDVNGDGEITVEDYSAAVNAALSGENTVPEDLSKDADYSKAVADADCDGVIDVLDVALLERKLNA